MLTDFWPKLVTTQAFGVFCSMSPAFIESVRVAVRTQAPHVGLGDKVLLCTDGQSPAVAKRLTDWGAVTVTDSLFESLFRIEFPGASAAFAYEARGFLDWWLLVRSTLFVGNPSSSFSGMACMAKLEQRRGVCYPHMMAFPWVMYRNAREE